MLAFSVSLFHIPVHVGILLWELWSGGKTPYPTFTNPQVLDEVSPHNTRAYGFFLWVWFLHVGVACLCGCGFFMWVWLILHVGVASSFAALQVLMGYRLEKPRPCRQEVYEIMQRCWSSVSPSL